MAAYHLATVVACHWLMTAINIEDSRLQADPFAALVSAGHSPAQNRPTRRRRFIEIPMIGGS
jgi:hypothetical protein